MYDATLDHGRIISAFLRSVPGSYVRDYRPTGYIVVARGYKDIPWRDQTTTRNVYRSVPSVTLLNLARGVMRPQTRFDGVRMVRPGWRQEFRRAMSHLTHSQMSEITRRLGVGEVFPGVH